MIWIMVPFHLLPSALRVGIPMVLGLLSGACQVADPAPDSSPAKLEQWSGQHSGVTEASHRVLRDRAAWNAFWPGVQQPPPRSFDPDREMAVAVFAGERRTGGFSLSVVSASPANGRFVVTYLESPPPRGAMVTQALTSPWALAVVPRTDLPVDVQPAATPQSAPSRK